MRTVKMLAMLLAACAVMVWGPLEVQAEESTQDNLLPAGEYQAGSGGVPEGWSVDKSWMSGHVKLMEEDGTEFIRIHKAPTGMEASADMPDGVGSVKLSTRVRLADYEQGAKGWDNCNLMVSFVDENGEALNNVWKEGLKFRKDQGWTDVGESFTVPEGTKKVVVALNHKASAGKFDVGSIVLTAE